LRVRVGDRRSPSEMVEVEPRDITLDKLTPRPSRDIVRSARDAQTSTGWCSCVSLHREPATICTSSRLYRVQSVRAEYRRVIELDGPHLGREVAPCRPKLMVIRPPHSVRSRGIRANSQSSDEFAPEAKASAVRAAGFMVGPLRGA